MEAPHFLAPRSWMGQWVKGLWPEVMCVPSGLEYVTARARVSRALLPSVMVVNDIQDVKMLSQLHPDVELTLNEPGQSCGKSNK